MNRTAQIFVSYIYAVFLIAYVLYYLYYYILDSHSLHRIAAKFLPFIF